MKTNDSKTFVEQAVIKRVSRAKRTLREVAFELNVNDHTARNCVKKGTQSKAGAAGPKEKRPQAWSAAEQLQANVLDAMRKPAVGCFVAGTLVHTRDGLKPIEQIQVGDWVLSRPDDPQQGNETAYKRVSKTLRFEDKEVIRCWWAPDSNSSFEETESVYGTPNHPVWLNPHGWVAMGRLHLPGKLRPGTIHRGDDEWLGRELILANGSCGAMLDVSDLYRTDRPEIAFEEEDDWGFGGLTDFSSSPPIFGEDLPYDYKKWGNPVNETRERYTTTVYNLEVEHWHSYFVGKTGLWVQHAGPGQSAART